MTIKAEIVRLRKLGSFVEAIGEVTNDSSDPVRNAWAVISYFDDQGELIREDRAPVKVSDLLPGQKSSFRAIGRWKPEIARGSIHVADSSEPARQPQEC